MCAHINRYEQYIICFGNQNITPQFTLLAQYAAVTLISSYSKLKGSKCKLKIPIGLDYIHH